MCLLCKRMAEKLPNVISPLKRLKDENIFFYFKGLPITVKLNNLFLFYEKNHIKFTRI